MVPRRLPEGGLPACRVVLLVCTTLRLQPDAVLPTGSALAGPALVHSWRYARHVAWHSVCSRSCVIASTGGALGGAGHADTSTATSLTPAGASRCNICWHITPGQVACGLPCLVPQVPGEPQSFIDHIRLGVEAAAHDPGALLLFSGGQTRKAAGPRSEGLSYWQVADAAGWFNLTDVRSRAFTEVRNCCVEPGMAARDAAAAAHARRVHAWWHAAVGAAPACYKLHVVKQKLLLARAWLLLFACGAHATPHRRSSAQCAA